MYILVNNARMILGVFTSKKWLNNALKVVKKQNPESTFYYQKIVPNEFNSTLFNFWTMHPEKLIEIPKDTFKI